MCGLCRTSAMGCRGVRSVWSGRFCSSPSGNSETHTVPHTKTHTYTRVHTNALLRTRYYMLRKRRKRSRTHTRRNDRACTRHSRKSHTDRRAHRKISKFPNTCRLMNTTTKGKKLSCLRMYTHQKLQTLLKTRTHSHTMNKIHPFH